MAVERRPATSSAPSDPRLTRTARLPLPSSDLAAAAGLPGPRQRLQLAAVRGQDVGQLQRGCPEAGGRRRVQDRGRAREPPQAERLVRRAGPDLVPDEHDVVGSERQPLQRPADLDRIEGHVRPAGDRDAVLAVAVDQDQGHAGRLVERDEPVQVDALGRERRARVLAERVAPDRADERDVRPEPGGRDGRVGALAAVVPLVAAADDGLAGAGQPLDGDDQVDVDGPDDDDPAGHDRPTTP